MTDREPATGETWRLDSTIDATIATVGLVSVEIQNSDGEVFAWEKDRFLRRWEFVRAGE